MTLMFSRLGYSLKQTFSQLWKNKGTNFAAAIAIIAMMLILGLFLVAFVNVDLFANVIKQDYNVVEVFFAEGADDATIESTGKQIEALEGVDEIEFRSKEEALEIMKERWGENGYLLDNLNNNPLPDSYLVYVTDKDAADSVSKEAAGLKGVEDVNYYQDTVEKLAKITHFIQVSSIVVMAFLIIVSIIIVANTTKLTVFNRQKEIGIMKYLGATDWFVRGPFILEGIILGTFSACVATGLLHVIYVKIIDLIGPDVVRVLSVPIVPANYMTPNLLIIFLALGVGIGTCGSIISIRKFLDK